jgi:transcriptional regulator with XRE-family HTH domain
MNIKQKLGKKIKLLRIEKGWSQEQLALNAELDRTYVPSIEKGERNISINVIEKIANAFQIEIYQLLKF